MTFINGDAENLQRHARRKEAALQRAWRDLCARYIREGRKMIVWRNNRVEHADPSELLAEADRTAQRDA